MQRVKVRMPRKYEITAEETSEGIWKLDYAEYHTEQDWEESKTLSREIFPRMSGIAEMKLDDSERKLYYTIQGPKPQVFTILAGEFLGMTPLGQMSFNDLIGTITVALARAGTLEKKQGESTLGLEDD